MLFVDSSAPLNIGTGAPREGLLYAQLAHCKPRFVDTGRLRSRSQDVCFYRDVVGTRYPQHLIKETARHQLSSLLYGIL